MALSEGYSFLRIQVKKCYVEILTPPKIQSNMVVLQMHGGGYIGRMKNAYRNYAKEYADMRNGMKVYSLDYRVAPRHPYPAALHDAVAVYHLLESLGYDSGQIILAGDSAGWRPLSCSVCLFAGSWKISACSCCFDVTLDGLDSIRQFL